MKRCTIPLPTSPVRVRAAVAIMTMLLALGLSVMSPARAGVVIGNLANGGSFSYGGMTFSVANCTASQCSGMELETVSTSGGIQIEFLGNGTTSNGSSIYSQTSSALVITSWGLTLNVTGTFGTQIQGFSSAVTGAYPSGSGYYIETQAVLSGPASCSTSYGGSASSTCTNTATGGSPGQSTFAQVSTLSIAYNFGIASQAGNTITLSNASATFNTIPEPGSLSVMIVGVASLLFLRHRRPGASRRRA